GYNIEYSSEKPDIPETTFRAVSGIDTLDSLGGVFATDGTIRDLLLGSPLHRAGLGPGMTVIGINEHRFSANRLKDALSLTSLIGKLTLLVSSGDSFEHHTVIYDGGPRYMRITRDANQQDLLEEILKPRP
ncbi:MAG: hypothetical protein KDA91_25935, partial [Planctomycetaceae bacterium]|nr:hypothetical protein [Planctomycetaceae bacterium]